MSNWQVSSDLDLIFMVQWSKLIFCVLVYFTDTISILSIIFGVWNDCKVYMSKWQVSSDLDLIFMVQWSKLNFCVLVYFWRLLNLVMFGVYTCITASLGAWHFRNNTLHLWGHHLCLPDTIISQRKSYIDFVIIKFL